MWAQSAKIKTVQAWYVPRKSRKPFCRTVVLQPFVFACIFNSFPYPSGFIGKYQSSGSAPLEMHVPHILLDIFELFTWHRNPPTTSSARLSTQSSASTMRTRVELWITLRLRISSRTRSASSVLLARSPNKTSRSLVTPSIRTAMVRSVARSSSLSLSRLSRRSSQWNDRVALQSYQIVPVFIDQWRPCPSP